MNYKKKQGITSASLPSSLNASAVVKPHVRCNLKMKEVRLIILLFTLTAIQGFGQIKYQEYKNYALEWDSLEHTNYLLDTSTGKRIKIDFRHSSKYQKHSFRHGFVYVSIGDMKGLMALDGTKLLDECHFIRFYEKDSLLTAWCHYTGWILMNFNGDTLQIQPQGPANYAPKVSGNIFPARALIDSIGLKFGYLDKGKWVIEPQFEDALPFENGYAKVKIDGKWSIIDANGTIIKEPLHDHE